MRLPRERKKRGGIKKFRKGKGRRGEKKGIFFPPFSNLPPFLFGLLTVKIGAGRLNPLNLKEEETVVVKKKGWNLKVKKRCTFIFLISDTPVACFALYFVSTEVLLCPPLFFGVGWGGG